MTEFQEQAADDFRNVLANEKEFGRFCSWNGYKLQIAQDASLEQGEPATNGVNAERKRLVCLLGDLTPKPKPTEQVTLDGEYWQITDVKTPLPYLIITLERRTA